MPKEQTKLTKRLKKNLARDLLAAARNTAHALRDPDLGPYTALSYLARVRHFADRLDLVLRGITE